jgi:hypothetical protein
VTVGAAARGLVAPHPQLRRGAKTLSLPHDVVGVPFDTPVTKLGCRVPSHQAALKDNSFFADNDALSDWDHLRVCRGYDTSEGGGEVGVPWGRLHSVESFTTTDGVCSLTVAPLYPAAP